MLLEMRVFGLAIDPFNNAPIIILKDAEDKNVLPIWIGPLEASAIATQLEKIQLARPMTHDLLKDIFKNLGVTVSKVEITDLEDNVYYAVIYLIVGNTCHTIDARPSDAIAVALRANSPIFVEKKVLEKSRNVDAAKQANRDEKSQTEWLEILENLSPENFGKYKM
ncbi:MAG: bifunctional nuclease family protein [Deltaproteobacteria bacterium]|nr:bifunctional nuclease family protein [Deltaproteobacteria bacterium]MBI3754852.1 bifunctional nuclease family protein [Deltaproteobacteria bacterium]